MKTILVPIDYSDNSQNILAYALETARVASADVIVFHVFFPIMSPPAAHDATDVVLALEEKKTRELEQFADRAKQVVAQIYCLQTSLITDACTGRKVSDFDGVNLSCIARMGVPHDQIHEAIRKYKADLVVMGMQEGEALSQAVLGSTTISVIQESNVPVLAVPKGIPYRGFKSVVFAADLHKLPVHADLHLLQDFIKVFQPRLQVLHLCRTGKQLEKFKAKDTLKDFIRYFEDVDYDVSIGLCENVSASIQEFIKEQQADLLVLIPQKHTFFERLLNKSVTGRVTAHPLVPLLALPSNILHHPENLLASK